MAGRVVGALALGDYREVVERVDYDAFGVSSHLFGADVNQDQQVTTDDTNVVHTKMGASNYDLRQDINCDSVADGTDEEIIALYEGRTASKFLFSDDTVDGKGLCGPDIVIGYGGYVRHQTSRLWLARHRWYNAETARWLQRDPAGNVESNSLYAYCGGESVGYTDPFGLCEIQTSSIETCRVRRQVASRSRCHQAWLPSLMPPAVSVGSSSKLCYTDKESR